MARPTILIERTLLNLERTRNEFEFDLSACVNTRDSEQEIERRTDEEMTIREQLSQQRKHSIDDDENGNEYANDASQDRNARKKPIDEKNVTERQYSAEEHERSTKQNDESRWIEFKLRNTVHCSEKELSKCDQETCNNKVISNGHNKRPRVQTTKGAYEKTQFELEAQSPLNIELEEEPQAQRSMLHCKGVLDLLRLTRVHFQCRLLLAMFARFLDLKNLVHQAISS